MDKEIYFEQLRQNLRRIPQTEIDEAIAYHREYSIDAGLDSFEKLQEKFGAPKELAAKIYAESAVNTMEKQKDSWLKPFGIGLAAFFLLPVSFPLAIASIAITFAAVVTFLSVLVAVGSVIIAFAGAAVALFAASFQFLAAANFPAWAESFGASLALCSVTVLLVWLCFQLIKWIVRSLTKLMSKKVSGRSTHE